MKFKLLFAFLFFVSFLYGSEKELKIGILYEKIFTTKKEARIGSRLWIKQMKSSDEDFNLEIIFYEKEKNLLKDYKDHKISVIISNATLYYENKKFIDNLSSYKWIMSLSNNIFDEFYLIKNKDSSFSLDNISKEKILYKDEMAKVWLDSIFYKSRNRQIENDFQKVEKVNKLIFNVFFNKDKLSIISKSSYDTLIKLNPQIKSKTEIIEKSEPIFFNGIGFARENLSQTVENMLEKMRTKLMKKEDNFNVLSFTDIQKVFVLKNNELEKTDKFYQEYFNLKNN